MFQLSIPVSFFVHFPFFSLFGHAQSRHHFSGLLIGPEQKWLRCCHFIYANQQMLQSDWLRDPYHCSLLQSDWLRPIWATLTTNNYNVLYRVQVKRANKTYKEEICWVSPFPFMNYAPGNPISYPNTMIRSIIKLQTI